MSLLEAHESELTVDLTMLLLRNILTIAAYYHPLVTIIIAIIRVGPITGTT